jgi:hypothetical protein
VARHQQLDRDHRVCGNMVSEPVDLLKQQVGHDVGVQLDAVQIKRKRHSLCGHAVEETSSTEHRNLLGILLAG